MTARGLTSHRYYTYGVDCLPTHNPRLTAGLNLARSDIGSMIVNEDCESDNHGLNRDAEVPPRNRHIFLDYTAFADQAEDARCPMNSAAGARDVRNFNGVTSG